MYADQKAVIHDIDRFQPFRVPPELLSQESPLLRTQFQYPVPVEPIQIFHDGSWVLRKFILGTDPANC